MRKSKHRKLWIWLWITVIAIAVIGSGIGIGVKIHMDNQAEQQSMVRIMNSKEVNKVIKRALTNDLDSKAFTPEGVIHSYTVEQSSIEHNPMGGIQSTLIINNQKDMKVGIILNKNGDKYDEDRLVSTTSPALYTKLDREK